MALEPSFDESYPPPFRPTHRVEQDDSGSDSNGGSAAAESERWGYVPAVDVQRLTVDQWHLGEACREWGVIRLVNHGIPSSLLGELHEQAKEIFKLSFESKQALNDSTNDKPFFVSYFWGTPVLNPSGAALLQGHTNRTVEWVEGFNVPIAQLSRLQSHPHHIFDSFRQLLEEYGVHLARVARAIYEAMVENLNSGSNPNPNLDSKLFESDLLAESTGLLRVYRYLTTVASLEATAGMAEHTDSSILSILSQNHVAGLQVFKDDDWLTVEPIPHTLILNVGDMMQAMSNDEYKSPKHRVMVKEKGEEERISLCYFVFPPAESFIRSSRYRPFTYGEFRAKVQEDVRGLGHKLGLQHFKLPSDPTIWDRSPRTVHN